MKSKDSGTVSHLSHRRLTSLDLTGSQGRQARRVTVEAWRVRRQAVTVEAWRVGVTDVRGLEGAGRAMASGSAHGALVGDALESLRTISKRSSPLSPYLADHEVFRRLDAPHTMGQGWASAEAAERHGKHLGEDPEVVKHVLTKERVIEYSLKHKLRDHVHDLFNALAKVDSCDEKRSIAQTSYQFDHAMKKELSTIENGNRVRTNLDSKWAEQRARAKMLGLSTKR